MKLLLTEESIEIPEGGKQALRIIPRSDCDVKVSARYCEGPPR